MTFRSWVVLACCSRGAFAENVPIVSEDLPSVSEIVPTVSENVPTVFCLSLF